MTQRTFVCPKCGYDEDVEVSYTVRTEDSIQEEYLKCVCGRCSYTWNEETSDNKTKAEIEVTEE